jgi:hypothetical protein
MKKVLKGCKRIVSKIRAFLKRGDEDWKKIKKIQNSCKDLQSIWSLLNFEIDHNISHLYLDPDSEREIPNVPFEEVMSKLNQFSIKYKSEETFTPSILSELLEVEEYCEKMFHECDLVRRSKKNKK